MTPHPDRRPGVWRIFATYLLNVLGAAAGPLAAGIWFSDALGPRRVDPENASAWRGFAAAGGVALALTAFGSLDGAGVGGAIKRGLALGAASVGGAAGASITTTFCCVGAILCWPHDDWAGERQPTWFDEGVLPGALFVVVVVSTLVVGLVLSCRLWWHATRAPKTSVQVRSLVVEGAVALAVAAGIVALGGGLRQAGSPFASTVLLFVVVGHARGARPAAVPSAGGSPP